jgi:predicted Fe-S protein YdhL (DUF1289 family)
MASETSISSPCNRVCVVHPVSRICVGCGRSLDEIACWLALSEAERMAIMAQLPARLARLKAAEPATKAEPVVA